MSRKYDFAKREDWLSLLAVAQEAEIREGLANLGNLPAFTWLRPPQIGSVMVRGRQGGTGAPFNLGEMTVTRASLTLEDGRVGHGYVQGRSLKKAEHCAILDALLQGDEAAVVTEKVLRPLAAGVEAVRAETAGKAAQTKVDFFTMARGED